MTNNNHTVTTLLDCQGTRLFVLQSAYDEGKLQSDYDEVKLQSAYDEGKLQSAYDEGTLQNDE